MPFFSCCVPGCTSSKRKLSQLQKYPWMEGVVFHSLPDKRKKRLEYLKWLRLIRREASWTPTKYTRICSRHFAPGEKVPTLFPYNSYKSSTNKRSTKTSRTEQEILEADDDKENMLCTQMYLQSSDLDDTPDFVGEIEIADQKIKCERTVPVNTCNLEFANCPPPLDHPYCVNDTTVTMTTSECQTDISFIQMDEMERSIKDRDGLFREIFIEKVTRSDKSVKDYTGLPSVAILFGLFNILVSKCSKLKYWSGAKSAEEKSYQDGNKKKPGPERKLTMFQEYILTLVRFRLGLVGFLACDLFGVSDTRISQIFITWITFMCNIFGKLIKWPSRNQVKKHMPRSFKCKYPNTRVIIDCTEFFFQKPRSPTAQSATYSTYKSRNTGKCLLGISPSGTFTFVSDVYGGNVSDRYITEHSNFLDLIEEGDDVMADRGFTIRDLLTKKKATLNMPPFTRKCSWGKKKRLNLCEIRQTRNIAKLRIHVERAIQRLKCFKLLKNDIPWKMKSVINQMVKVGVFFCNLLPKLVKK